MDKLILEAATSDEDFIAALERPRSNLSEIFGIATPQQDEQNVTLKYQPIKPKATQLPRTGEATSAAWNAQLAKVVTAYKDSVATGTAGVALLSNNSADFKLIVYKSKTNVLATKTLQLQETATCTVYKQSPYLQFYDDAQSYWSLLFAKAEDEAEFVDKLKVIKLNIVEVKSQTVEEISHEKKEEPPKVAEILPQATVVGAEHSKAALVSRMAKMGQKLPKFATSNSITTEYSDSSDTEEINTPLPMLPKPAIVPRSSKLTQKSQSLALAAANATSVGVYAAAQYPLQEAQLVQMLLSENRTQNTELRMNMNKLENKIEKVLDRIDVLGSNNTNQSTNKEDEILELEEKLLDLKKQNRKLKQSLETRRDSSTTESVATFVATRSVQLEALQLLPAAQNWTQLCSALLTQTTNLTADLNKANDIQETLRAQLKTSETLVEQTKLKQQEMQQHLEQAATQQLDSNANIQTLQSNLYEMELKTQKQQELIAVQTQQQSMQTQTALKQIMNNLYSNLATQLDELPADGQSLSAERMLSLLGKAIRSETLQAMQQLKD